MTQLQIMGKLEVQLASGITTEAEAVYLIVGIRKLLQHQQVKKQYKYLTFHCDWAVHSMLAGATAQEILKLFDAANIHLKTDPELHNLPPELRTEIESISKMEYFEQELKCFLKSNGLPGLDTTRPDGWIHFQHLYAKVVEDVPLEMTAQNASATIASVTLNVDFARVPKHEGGHMWFRVRWVILNKNGLTGQISVQNSFALNPGA